MKILQINNCHYRRGGADVVYLNTGKLLEHHGHEVFYFSQENKNNVDATTSRYFIKETKYFEKSFVQKLLSIPRFFYSIEAKNKISMLIIELQPDIAHIHLYKASLTPAILTALKKFKIPIIISLHDLGFLCPHNLMLDGKMNLCSKCVNHTPLNCIIHKCNRNDFILSTLSSLEYLYQTTFFPFNEYFDRIITTSKFSQNIHISSKYFNIPIEHLYNFFSNLTETIPNNKKGNYFLYLGRLSGEKGINTLIDAWLKKVRKSKLLVAGTGELMDILQKKSIGANIDLMGYVPEKELSNLISNASFIVIPSSCYENNPITIIQAYSYGKPVIGSNVGGIPEIIINNKTGFTFTMNDTDELSDIISKAEVMDENTYSEYSLNCRKFSEDKFNDKEHYIKLMEIYKDTIYQYNRY